MQNVMLASLVATSKQTYLYMRPLGAVAALLHAGASACEPNSESDLKRTPLHAALLGHEAITTALEHGDSRSDAVALERMEEVV